MKYTQYNEESKLAIEAAVSALEIKFMQNAKDNDYICLHIQENKELSFGVGQKDIKKGAIDSFPIETLIQYFNQIEDNFAPEVIEDYIHDMTGKKFYIKNREEILAKVEHVHIAQKESSDLMKKFALKRFSG